MPRTQVTTSVGKSTKKASKPKVKKGNGKSEAADVEITALEKADLPQPEVNIPKDGELSPAESMKVLDQIRVLRDRIDSDYLELSELLFLTYQQQLYAHWGKETFEQFVNDELGFGLRKAQYLIGIHDYYVNEIGSAEVLEKVKELGWTKAKELRGVVTEDNYEQWVELAQTHSVEDLKEEVKRNLMKDKDGGFDEDGETAAPKEPSKLVKIKFVGEQYDNFIEATDRASSMCNSEKLNHIVDLICTDWLASNAFTTEGRNADLGAYLGKFEEQLGLRLFAFDPEKGQMVYGEDDSVRAILVEFDESGEGSVACGADLLEDMTEDSDYDEEEAEEEYEEDTESEEDFDDSEESAEDDSDDEVEL